MDLETLSILGHRRISRTSTGPLSSAPCFKGAQECIQIGTSYMIMIKLLCHNVLVSNPHIVVLDTELHFLSVESSYCSSDLLQTTRPRV